VRSFIFTLFTAAALAACLDAMPDGVDPEDGTGFEGVDEDNDPNTVMDDGKSDLPRYAIPSDLPELDPDEAARLLAERRLQAAGIAKQKSPWSGAGTAGEAATIEGLAGTWRVDPRQLAALEDDADGRVAFLNPYDGMLFDRPRLRDVFEFDYVLEQFKPKPQRKYGLFAHPILLGDRFVGMLEAELDRDEGLLRVQAVHEFLPFEFEELDMVRAEISELAQWLGAAVAEGRRER